MRAVKIHEAKTQFSKLIADVERGEEIVVQRGDVAVAKLVPLPKQAVRRAGEFADEVWMADDFDELPPEFDPYMR